MLNEDFTEVEWVRQTMVWHYFIMLSWSFPLLDFTHFKRRKRERLQLNGTG